MYSTVYTCTVYTSTVYIKYSKYCIQVSTPTANDSFSHCHSLKKPFIVALINFFILLFNNATLYETMNVIVEKHNKIRVFTIYKD